MSRAWRCPVRFLQRNSQRDSKGREVRCVPATVSVASPMQGDDLIVVVDDDDAGKENSKKLIRKLLQRGFEVRVAGAVA